MKRRRNSGNTVAAAIAIVALVAEIAAGIIVNPYYTKLTGIAFDTLYSILRYLSIPVLVIDIILVILTNEDSYAGVKTIVFSTISSALPTLALILCNQLSYSTVYFAYSVLELFFASITLTMLVTDYYGKRENRFLNVIGVLVLLPFALFMLYGAFVNPVLLIIVLCYGFPLPALLFCLMYVVASKKNAVVVIDVITAVCTALIYIVGTNITKLLALLFTVWLIVYIILTFSIKGGKQKRVNTEGSIENGK